MIEMLLMFEECRIATGLEFFQSYHILLLLLIILLFKSPLDETSVVLSLAKFCFKTAKT